PEGGRGLPLPPRLPPRPLARVPADRLRNRVRLVHLVGLLIDHATAAHVAAPARGRIELAKIEAQVAGAALPGVDVRDHRVEPPPIADTARVEHTGRLV